MSTFEKPILSVLRKQIIKTVPFWFMRQAGRYLPEYLDVRSKAGSFLNLVYDSEKAAEVTIQPLRRFGMDAAILFSDILVVPHVLGQDVRFEAGEGPRLDPLIDESDFSKLSIDMVLKKAQPVFDTVSRCRQKMKEEAFDKTTLIGFCGAPWTVICYMIEGHGSKDFAKARQWALKDPISFQKLIDIVTQASCLYLSGQIQAGAEVVKLFESWAGVLDEQEFERWVIEPSRKIVNYIHENHPDIPVIGFPRGAGTLVKQYAHKTGIECVAIDQMMSLSYAAAELQPIIPVQGNMDPVRLLVGGKGLESCAKDIISTLGSKPFIFNLGHGVIKETPISHVEKLSHYIHDVRI